MPLITRIKQAIQRLDGGAFQTLCDDWISRKVGGIICSLGTQTGTTKTTKGTPDSYFPADDGRYIFVEYTTQTDKLIAKIKRDLEKCLDEKETGIKHSEISKIIYCHTSSNVKAKNDAELHKLCADAGVDFKLYGIDRIAIDIANNFRNIAKDHLGISLDTGQILSLEDYIRNHDSNKVTAPLGIEFHCRENELRQLSEAFQKTDVVILTGNPGVGKTRIAIEYAKRYMADNSIEALVIQDKQLPLYDDIQTYFLSGFPYIVVVDDANQITQLMHILDLLKRDNIKLLITVREYAKAYVCSQVKQYAYPETIAIDIFTDDEIKSLVKDEFNIINEEYLKRIVDIADGNARLAILAGKLVVEKNSLASIADVSSLYEEYYGHIIRQIKSDSADGNKEMLVAGILAFFETMQESQIENLLAMLPEVGLNKEAFVGYINDLSEKEMVNIYHDRAYRIADQTFGNFIVKHVFIDKKIITLFSIIKCGFTISTSRTISATNMLMKVFLVDEIHEYVKNQLKYLWKELDDSDSPDFLSYVKSTFAVNPTETLLILKKLIDSTEKRSVNLHKEDFNENRKSDVIDDDILEIIGGLVRQHIEIQSATELFIEYFDKRPDLCAKFLNVVDQCFLIDTNSIRFEYDVQIELLTAVRKKMENWTNNNATLLFCELARKLLEYTFSPAEAGRGNTFIFYRISLSDSVGCRAYRSMIWQGFGQLICKPEYRDYVQEILFKLFGHHPGESKEVALFDVEDIKGLFNKLSPKKLRHCILASEFIQWINRIDSPYDVSFLKAYFENPEYQLIDMLEGDDRFVTYEKRIEAKKVAIQPFVKTAEIKGLKQLINACAEYESFAVNNAWNICIGLDIFFDALYEKDSLAFLDTVKYYIKRSTPFCLYSEKLICNLRQVIGNTELFSLLQSCDCPVECDWLYLYFFTLNKNEIEPWHVDAWYKYIENDDIQNTRCQGIGFLENFSSVDVAIIPNTCERLLHHKINPELKVVNFCRDLFNTYSQSAESIINIFEGRFDLLTELYLTVFRAKQNWSFDYKGELFVALSGRHSKFLHEYVDAILDHRIYFRIREIHLSLLYKRADYFSVFDNLAEYIISKEILIGYSLLESFITLSSDADDNSLSRRNDWVLHFIECNYAKVDLMRRLFSVIAMLDDDFRIQCVKKFLALNDVFSVFDRLFFEPMNRSWSGSEVPLIDHDVQFYIKLLSSMPSGVKYLEHRKKIENLIDYKNRYKIDIEIEEMMKNY